MQCVVVGIDSWHDEKSGEYWVNQYTGDEKKTRVTQWHTLDWVEEVQRRGAGEIVLNMMNQDGVRQGYDLTQLSAKSRLLQAAAPEQWSTFLTRSRPPMPMVPWQPPSFIRK